MSNSNSSGNSAPGYNIIPITITPGQTVFIPGQGYYNVVLPTTSQWLVSNQGVLSWTPPQENVAAPSENPKHEGCICLKCNEFNEFAEPNQEDGTFICYSCRQGW